jgi:hypothetical protein
MIINYVRWSVTLVMRSNLFLTVRENNHAIPAAMTNVANLGRRPVGIDRTSSNFWISAQSSRLAEFAGRRMSFNICRGTSPWPAGK